jgi:hypothetical protein
MVERVGNIDTPLMDGATFLPGSTHRLRAQFGVFDDAAGAAPVGGYIGWNAGTLSNNGVGTWSRTPGRLAPFTFSPNPVANGSPTSDPFTSLTQIDNTLGFQTFAWGCDGAGQPLPPPEPIIRGLNQLVSTYEVTVVAPNVPGTMNLTWSGNLFAVMRWNFDQVLSVPPDCDSGEAGTVFYGPIVAPPQTFSASLRMEVVPSPGTGACVLVLGCGGLIRRRR